MLATLVLLAILTTCWAVFKIKGRHMEKCAEKIPGDKGYPIIGNVLSYYGLDTSGVLKFMTDSGRKYREYGIFKSWIGYFLLVGITDPKYIEVIASSPHAVRKGPLVAALFHGLPKGVFTTDDIPTWKVLRKSLTKALTKKKIENEYHRTFVSKNKRFVKYLKEKRCGKEINVKYDLQNHANDMLSESVLGVETNEVEETQFQFIDCANQYVTESFSLAAFVGMFKKLEFMQLMLESNTIKKAVIEGRKFISWVFEERMKKINTNAADIIYYPDFLLKRKMEQNLTMDDIQRELIDIIFAGTETSTITLSSTLLFLAMFPEIQEEAYQEQVSILGENSMREPTPEDLASMVYLTRVLKEAIRFCSPSVIMKYATGDIQLDNYTIPKGTFIIISIDAACSDERFWEKPRSFYPDHFLPEIEAERLTYAYPVFGFGPRICPGIQYGMNTMKTVLSFILRNFRMSTTTKFEDLKVVYMLMKEFDAYMVKFEERTICNAGNSH